MIRKFPMWRLVQGWCRILHKPKFMVQQLHTLNLWVWQMSYWKTVQTNYVESIAEEAYDHMVRVGLQPKSAKFKILRVSL